MHLGKEVYLVLVCVSDRKKEKKGKSCASLCDYAILGESGADMHSLLVIEITENLVCVTSLQNLTC